MPHNPHWNYVMRKLAVRELVISAILFGIAVGCVLFTGMLMITDEMGKGDCERLNNVYSCKKVVTYVPVDD